MDETHAVSGIEDGGGVAGRLTLSVGEAAAVLGISRAKAYECVRVGELPALRFGRRIVVPVAALRELLSGGPAG